ncbi:MAG: pyridoxal phosphate-dependent decarboxylase family protein [Acidobacteriota bacterium]
MPTGSHHSDLWPVSTESLRGFAHQAIDWIVDYLQGVDGKTILPPVDPREVLAAFSEPLPESGLPPEKVFELFQEKVVRYATHLQHPGNFAYVPNSTDLVGVVADALAAALNQNVSLFRGGPSAAAVEKRVVDWLKQCVGFSQEGDGVLTSGGSLANLMALALARERAGVEKDLVFYISPEVHSSIHRALRFLGLGPATWHKVTTDGRYRMSARALAEAVAWDRQKGRTPAAVVASAGTICSGAVDPLEDIADLCEEENVWLHVDGAYGALAAMAPSGAWMRPGLARADSLSLDPHKWLFVPIDTSCLLVRDPQHMRHFFTLVPEYLKVSRSEAVEGVHHPMEQTVELTRRFRALRVWMSLKVYGARAIRDKIEQHLHLAKELASRLEASERFQLLAPVMTSIVCFRRTPAGIKALPEGKRDASLDRLNQEVMARLNRREGLFLSHCRLRRAFALRVCITHLRTTAEDIDRLWDALNTICEQVEKEMGFA